MHVILNATQAPAAGGIKITSVTAALTFPTLIVVYSTVL